MIIVHLMNVFNLFSDAGGKYETYNGVNIGLKWKVEHEGGQIQRCSICCLLLLHTLRIPMWQEMYFKGFFQMMMIKMGLGLSQNTRWWIWTYSCKEWNDKSNNNDNIYKSNNYNDIKVVKVTIMRITSALADLCLSLVQSAFFFLPDYDYDYDDDHHHHQNDENMKFLGPSGPEPGPYLLDITIADINKLLRGEMCWVEHPVDLPEAREMSWGTSRGLREILRSEGMNNPMHPDLRQCVAILSDDVINPSPWNNRKYISIGPWVLSVLRSILCYNVRRYQCKCHERCSDLLVVWVWRPRGSLGCTTSHCGGSEQVWRHLWRKEEKRFLKKRLFLP